MSEKLTEDEVVKATAKYLEEKGWYITECCLGGQHGVDIRAEKGKQVLVIEAKGAKGKRSNTTRASFDSGQIRTHFGVAILKVLEEKAKNPNIQIGITQPHDEKILKTLKPILPFMKQLEIKLFLVKPNKRVLLAT